MCARYYRLKDLKELYRRFGLKAVLSKLGPQYNISIKDPALVIPATEGDRVAKEMIFSIPNPWVPGQLLFNMRAESFIHKPSFRPYLKQRCLVIADGFIEPKEPADKTDKKAKKIPYRIDPRDRETLGLAGVYTADGFVIITTEPNQFLATLHGRMPCVLRREDEDIWLDARITEFNKLITLLAPFPPGALEIAEISPAINNSNNKLSEVLTPVQPYSHWNA